LAVSFGMDHPMAAHGHTPHVEEHADEWHHHGKEDGVPQAEHAGVINTWMLFQSFVVITVTVVVVLLAIVMYYKHYTTQQKALAIETDTTAIPTRSLKMEWNRQLGDYSAIGDKEGVYGIPVSEAMKKVVERYNGAAPAAPAASPAK
jgi:cell division protein FtsL